MRNEFNADTPIAEMTDRGLGPLAAMDLYVVSTVRFFGAQIRKSGVLQFSNDLRRPRGFGEF
jgi:hypothetical protein